MPLLDGYDSPFDSQRVRESPPLVKKDSDSDSDSQRQSQSQEAFLFDSQCLYCLTFQTSNDGKGIIFSRNENLPFTQTRFVFESMRNNLTKQIKST